MEYLAFIGIPALIVALFGASVAYKNYRRKSGVHARCGFVTQNSDQCSDAFISQVIIENTKDRAIAIYGIYLRFGANLYLVIERFEDQPLILKPYEIYKKDYGPLEFYRGGGMRFDLNNLLNDLKTPKNIVLSTNDGKFVAKDYVHHWQPENDYFKNNSTGIFHPTRTQFRGKDIGENIKYVIEFLDDPKNPEIVLVQPDDYRFKKFPYFTQEALASADTVRQFIQDGMDTGTLYKVDFKVYDADRFRTRFNGVDKQIPKKVRAADALRYHTIGRFRTYLSDLRRERSNKKAMAEQLREIERREALEEEQSEDAGEFSSRSSRS